MLDATTFEGMQDADARGLAKVALGLLAQSGVLKEQIRVNQENLISGNSEQSSKELARQIVEYRRSSQALQTIQELGETYYKETSNESST